MSMIDDYKRARNNIPILHGHFARSFVPKPEIEDFKNGFIFRYFAKQRNNPHANIVEIDKGQFKSHSEGIGGLNTIFYHVISLRWKIIGTLQNIQSTNFNSVENAELLMTGIIKRTGNLIQFAHLE